MAWRKWLSLRTPSSRSTSKYYRNIVESALDTGRFFLHQTETGRERERVRERIPLRKLESKKRDRKKKEQAWDDITIMNSRKGFQTVHLLQLSVQIENLKTLSLQLKPAIREMRIVDESYMIVSKNCAGYWYAFIECVRRTRRFIFRRWLAFSKNRFFLWITIRCQSPPKSLH